MRCPTCSALNPDGTSACAACGSPMIGAAPATGAAVPVLPILPPNSRLKGGAFAVKDVLGQGGFGITYKGGDLQLRRYVAIKEFFPYGAQRQKTTVFPPSGVTEDGYSQAKRGFVQEAMTLARFNHPGIVRVYGAFEENNTAYMVMELLEGQSLQKRLEEKGVLPEKIAVRLITQIGAALTAIHEAKLLHRDIKPDNVMLVSGDNGEERAVLIDFGTAREFAANKTKTMTAMVTHGYAPLEQYGKQAKFGPYTDVYALGATLYHCLTGQLPVSVMDRMAGVELKSPEQVNPNISRAVSDAVMHALQIKAPDRPQTVAEWTESLARVKTPAAGAGASTRTTLLPDNAPQNATVPAQPATGAGSESYSQACPHCGAKMSYFMTVCPVCHKSNDSSAPAVETTKQPWWKEKATSGGGESVTSGLSLSEMPFLVPIIILVLAVLAAIFYGRHEAARMIPDPDSNTTTTLTISPPVSATNSVGVTANSIYAPPPAPVQQAVEMTGADAYDAACDFMRRRLNNPSTANLLSYSNSNCNGVADGYNRWQIDSMGSARGADGDTVYFTWSATITYSPTDETWRGSTRITHTE